MLWGAWWYLHVNHTIIIIFYHLIMKWMNFTFTWIGLHIELHVVIYQCLKKKRIKNAFDTHKFLSPCYVAYANVMAPTIVLGWILYYDWGKFIEIIQIVCACIFKPSFMFCALHLISIAYFSKEKNACINWKHCNYMIS